MLKFVSADVQTIIEGLTAGNYTMQETVAPAGYILSTATVDFTIAADGTVTGETAIENTAITATISKYDISNSKELAGATLTVKSTDGHDLTNVTAKRGENEVELTRTTDKTSFSFVSEEIALVLSKLPAGTYTLTETQAPNGYVVAEEMTFQVAEDGTISVKNANGVFDAVTDKTIVMEDALTELTISKVEIAGEGTAELAGATLTITKAEGNTADLSDVKATQNGAEAENFSAAADKVSFNSVADYATIIQGLPAGKYILTETGTPTGYATAESITFTMNEDGTISDVANAYETTDEANNKIVMLDEVSKHSVNISKKDAATSEEVAGATLQISGAGINDSIVLKRGETTLTLG